MKLKLTLLLVGGAALCHGFSATQGLREAHEPNSFALKRSPYGEILGAAMQDPIHLISHGGMGHDHMKPQNEEECEVCGVDHSEDPSGSECHDKLWLQSTKIKLLAYEAEVRQHNLPGKRNKEVRLYELAKVRELIAAAYAMDPTNYGSYNIVTRHAKSKSGLAGVEEIAAKTLKATEGRNWDPEDALTAASAAENLLIFRATEFGFEDKARLAADYQFFVEKVANYEKVFSRAIEDKRIYNFKQEKINEMVTNFSYFNYTMREYGKKLGIEPASK